MTVLCYLIDIISINSNYKCLALGICWVIVGVKGFKTIDYTRVIKPAGNLFTTKREYFNPQNFFGLRVVGMWNDLGEDVMEAQYQELIRNDLTKLRVSESEE